ncbi:MAG: DEAD/DEAH box helicase [Alistipes sp.]|nr:DEAD/DEAH box helicase [Candidatus Alistipes equi]
MNDLFSHLSSFKTEQKSAAPHGKAVEGLLFIIEFDSYQRAFLRVCDQAGNDIDTDYRLYSAETYHMLKAINDAKKESSNEISWDSDSERIYFDKHPYLASTLCQCSNISTASLSPIYPSSLRYQVVLKMFSSEENIYSTPTLVLLDSCTNSKQESEFKMIDESIAIIDNKLVNVEPIGNNYLKLNCFCSTLPKNQMGMLTSIFLSNFSNVSVAYNDKEAIFSDTPVISEPALVVDKVDSDNALFFHVSNSINGFSLEFVEDFGPTYLSEFSSADELVIHQISYTDIYDNISYLKKSLVSASANKNDAKEIFIDGNFFIVPSNTAEKFLLRDMAEIVRRFRIFGIENLQKFKIRHTRPSLKLDVSYGIDFLEGSGNLNVDGETFTIKDFLSQYERNRYIQLSNGDRAIIDSNYVKKLQRLVSKGGKNNKLKISFFDIPEIEKLLSEVPNEGAFKRSREFYSGFNSLKDLSLSKTKFKAELRPYQVEGVKWIDYLRKNKMGGCLADDMGLGKTVQTIAVLTTIYPKEKKPSLIVMPRSLLFNWEAELKRFAPHLHVSTYYGINRDLQESLRSQIILTTYAMVRNDIEKFSKEEFLYVILDESQNIKNITAQITHAVYLLKCQHKLALSGTPIENNLGELYSLFRFLNPAMFGSEEEFNAKYATPIQKENDDEAMTELRHKIFPFMMRRLKQNVLNELPDRTDQTTYIDMEPEHARFYEIKRKKYQEQIHESIAKDGVSKSQFLVLQALTELRRIASVPESLSDGTIKSSKIPTLCENIQDATLNGHKVVVFFNFIAGIEITGTYLEDMGIDYLTMTGATRDRESIVNRFQNDRTCKVLLMTLKTGGVGLNLTSADVVFIVEPWWNKAAEEQAISRLHRIGQKNSVLSFSIVTRGTIEEKIRLLQEKKSDLVDNLMSTDISGSKILTEEDINFILG